MDAIKLIEKQHDEIDQLFEELKEAKSDEDKRKLFAQVADSLAAHMAMEEEVFYPAVKARSIEPLLLEATEEHLAIRRVLNDLLDTQPSDPRFAAKLSVVREQHEHHANEEEEKDLHPLVRKMFEKDELEELGQQMRAMFDRRVASSPRRHLPEETDHAAAI